MLEIIPLDPDQVESRLPELVELLKDCVDGGASVGFLPPLDDAEARKFWRAVRESLADGSRILLAAIHDGRLCGSVQLGLPSMPNASHRAEVMKLLVRRDARKRGIGKALMEAIHETAIERSRPLLVLDTRRGDDAERLYLALGYRLGGYIPRYARSAGGELHETVFLYREVGGEEQSG